MSGWTTVQLSEVSDFVRGVTFKPTDVVEAGTNGSVSCMRTKNVQLDLDLSDVWSIDRSHVKRDEQYLNEGDLLISSANSWNLVGKCSWVPALESPSTFGGFVTVLRPKPQQVDPRYLYRFFSSARVQATVRSFARQTTNISNLDLKRCAALPIPLPPINEQRRIAAILDHADALRAKRREALARLDELTQSIFIDMFGVLSANEHDWTTVEFASLILDGPQNGLYKPASEYGSGTRILRIDGFHNSAPIVEGSLKRVRIDDADVEKYALRENDIVINRVNSIEHLGKSALVPSLAEVVVFESNMMRIGLNEDLIDPSFCLAQLQNGFVRGQILGSAKAAVNQSSINQTDVRSFSFRVPPLAQQRLYASRVESIRSMKAVHHASLSVLNALFVSLQSRAFRGEL